MTGFDFQELPRREREVLEVLYKIGSGAVAEVREAMADPPGYDSVRTVLRILESKGLVKRRKDSNRHVYRPVARLSVVKHRALRSVVRTFFGGSVADTVAAAIDLEGRSLSEAELTQIEEAIAKARREGK